MSSEILKNFILLFFTHHNNPLVCCPQLIEPVSPAAQPSRTHHLSNTSIPPHSLVAFGLFLRLPGYAEVLLKERRKAQCLLRLMLGVTDDGSGSK